MNIPDILSEINNGGECDASLYNKISNILYKDFGISSAEITLLVWYVIKEIDK